MIDLEIKNAITSFDRWGKIKPSTANGHALIARAFHTWSKGGLALYAYEPHNKPAVYFACLQTKPKNDPLFIHWSEGICKTKADGDKCFHTDTKQQISSWYSYYATINAIPNKYPEIQEAFQTHLLASLGPFDYQQFHNWYNAIAKNSTPASRYPSNLHQQRTPLKLVTPTWSSNNDCYQRITSQNIWYDPVDTWPPSLSADELIHLLIEDPVDHRPSLSQYIEKLQAYTEKYPSCQWTKEHTTRWVTRLSSTRTITMSAISNAFYDYDTGWEAKPGPDLHLPDWVDYIRVDIAMVLASKQHANNHRDLAWLVENSTDPRKVTFEYPQTSLAAVIPFRPEYAIAKCTRQALAGCEGWRLLPKFQKVTRHLFEVPDNQYSSEAEYFNEVLEGWMDTWTPNEAAETIKTFIQHPDWIQFTDEQYNNIAQKLLPSELYTLYDLAGRDQWILISTLSTLNNGNSLPNNLESHSLHELI